MNLASKQIPLADPSLFLGTSFKRIQPLRPLEELFTRSPRVESLTVADLESFSSLYKTYRSRIGADLRVAPEISLSTLKNSLRQREVTVFGVKDNKDELIAAVAVYFLRLPNNLGKLYFGNDFHRFGLLRMFCCKKNSEAVAADLLRYTFLELKKIEIKACLAYVTPQHSQLCAVVLPRKDFKRCFGQNFMPDNEALFCLELNA